MCHVTTELNNNENNNTFVPNKKSIWDKIRSPKYDPELEMEDFEDDDEQVSDPATAFEKMIADGPENIRDQVEEGNVPSWLKSAGDVGAEEEYVDDYVTIAPNPYSQGDEPPVLSWDDELTSDDDLARDDEVFADDMTGDQLEDLSEDASSVSYNGLYEDTEDSLSDDYADDQYDDLSEDLADDQYDEYVDVPYDDFDESIDGLSDDPTNPNGVPLVVPVQMDSTYTVYTSEYDQDYEDASYEDNETAETQFAAKSNSYDAQNAPSDQGKFASKLSKLRNSSGVRWGVVAVAIVVTLAVVYVLGVRRFTDRFLPNTRINGFDVSSLTVEEATEALESQTSNYACEASVGDFDATFKGVDIALDRNEEAMANEAYKGHNAYAWPIALLFAPTYEVDDGLTVEDGILNAIVNAAVDEYNQRTLPHNNARIEFNEDTGLYELLGTTEGTAVDGQAVFEAASNDVHQFHTTSNPSPETALHPATVFDIPNYAQAVQNANRSRTTDIAITVNAEPVIVSEAYQNAEWVTIDDSPSVVVDEDALREWAESQVSYAVFHMDDWSNYYLDVDAFVAGFSDRLSKGIVDDYEAPTYDELRTEGESREKAYAKGGWDSTLGRYIDIDLESQFARLFDEGGNVIWESAFVSGDMYEGHSTVTGTFSIYSMQMNTVLVGMDYNGDGQPDYESFVNYWMPFYGGYGLHDATWRANFGGEYYYYNGSHGCVNLPYSKAEELFGITFVGEVVNVHW